MPGSVVVGWLLAALGATTVVMVAVVTLIISLKAGTFVWETPQTMWAIAGGVAFVLGIITFMGSIYSSMKD